MADGNTIVNITYAISVSGEFFNGTLEEYFEAVQGEQGDPGPRGLSGRAVITVSNGATIVHDGSGTATPTFSDNNGVGTLASNGNAVSSVSGSFNAAAGGYQFNHDSPSEIVAATQYGPNGFPVPGSSPRRISATQIDWLGLTGDALHSFIWTF